MLTIKLLECFTKYNIQSIFSFFFNIGVLEKGYYFEPSFKMECLKVIIMIE